MGFGAPQAANPGGWPIKAEFPMSGLFLFVCLTPLKPKPILRDVLGQRGPHVPSDIAV